MAKTRTANTEGNPAPVARSLAIAEGGVKTGEDFASLMSALMSDVIEGRMAPNVANAACNAGGKLLRIIELEYKYGSAGSAQASVKPTLRLAS